MTIRAMTSSRTTTTSSLVSRCVQMFRLKQRVPPFVLVAYNTQRSLRTVHTVDALLEDAHHSHYALCAVRSLRICARASRLLSCVFVFRKNTRQQPTGTGAVEPRVVCLIVALRLRLLAVRAHCAGSVLGARLRVGGLPHRCVAVAFACSARANVQVEGDGMDFGAEQPGNFVGSLGPDPRGWKRVSMGCSLLQRYCAGGAE